MFSWSKKTDADGKSGLSRPKLALDDKMQAVLADLSLSPAQPAAHLSAPAAAPKAETGRPATPTSASPAAPVNRPLAPPAAGSLTATQPSRAAASAGNGQPNGGRSAPSGPGGAPTGGAGAPPSCGGEGIFKEAPPEGHAKKVSEVLGEVVWLMSQSQIHKQFFIADLEWFVMTPVLLQQFRLFYAKDRPMGVVLWAFVDEETEARLAQGATKLRTQDWKCGERLWVVEVIAPFGGAEEMVKDLKAKVFPNTLISYVAMTPDGKKDVKVV